MSTASESEHDTDSGDGPVDKERVEIREKLSSLSFEELQNLKERLGAKVYREVISGTSARQDYDGPRVFKRENKNRPREMSSKKPVSMLSGVERVKKKELRDPRFDPLCGDYDKKTFQESYSFLDEVRARDADALRAELRDCEDPDRRHTIQLLLQRLTNRAREEANNKKKRERRREEKEQMLRELKEGKKPFITKSEKRVKELVEQYVELRQSGQLEKHIQRRHKKSTQKARKRQLAPPT